MKWSKPEKQVRLFDPPKDRKGLFFYRIDKANGATIGFDSLTWTEVQDYLKSGHSLTRIYGGTREPWIQTRELLISGLLIES